MVVRLLRVLALAWAWALAPPCPVLADDSDHLNRVTPAPNVVVILDTSQGMTWHNSGSATRGDEYPGWPRPGDRTPMARKAKGVLSTVVDGYFSKLQVGLVSYAESAWLAIPHSQARTRPH